MAGETPNLAARLQGVAAPGQVVIGANTRLLIGETFEIEDLGAHELKGFGEPVRAWRVLGEGEVAGDEVAKRVGGGLPLVGRQEELGLLLRSWETSKEGHGQAVLIQGEAGIGKSRLIEALREQVAGQDYLWVAHRCSPYHANSTLYPVIEHLKRALGWTPEDGAQAKLEKLEAALKGQSLPLAEAVPLYAELMSLALPEDRYAPLELSAKERRERTLDALARWLLEEAERRPVLNVWEDLHWADPTTLELLALYIEQSPTVSMMNVVTYRPEFAPSWSMRSHMTPITLNRMDRPEVEALIVQQAGGKALPGEVVEYIVGKTDGVPLYVEELTKVILEANFLREGDDGYELTGPLSGVTVPATLQDSLMARLDRLPTIREIAQLGAVLGREFTYEMVQAIASLEETTLQEGLDQLVDAELLYQRGRRPRAKYIFKHALVQDAAYQSLLKRTRQFYHRQVAELLENRFPEIVQTQPELVAHHYTEAGVVEQAIVYWQRAGRRALERSANAEAIAHCSKGLELVRGLSGATELAKEELALLLALGPALMASKGFGAPDVREAYARARELCEQVGDAAQFFPATWGLWQVTNAAGESDAACEIADELLAIAGKQADKGMLLQAHHSAWTSRFARDELQSVREHAEQGIALYEIDQHRAHAFIYGGHDPGVCCRLTAGLTSCFLGFPDRARDLVVDAVALAEELAYPFTVAMAHSFSGTVYLFRREPQSVQARAESLSALCADHEFPYFKPMATMLHGWALAAQGEAVKGGEEMREGLDAIREAGLNRRLSFQLAILAEGYAWVGNIERGLEALAEAETVIEKTGEHRWEPEVHRLKGELLLAESARDRPGAEAHMTRALDIARRQGAKWFELRAATGLARLWQGQRKHAKARELLEPVYDWFTEGFDTPDLKEAKALLDEMS
ncbi:MAG: AAA family ATPase [Planctomycetota bacterium]|nr:AAA family ATPase [Planctomycetota bacterium]